MWDIERVVESFGVEDSDLSIACSEHDVGTILGHEYVFISVCLVILG